MDSISYACYCSIEAIFLNHRVYIYIYIYIYKRNKTTMMLVTIT